MGSARGYAALGVELKVSGGIMAAKIVVACGAGVATSHAVASRLKKLLSARGVEAEIEAVAAESLPGALEGANAYVAVVKTDAEYDIPTFNGVAFLTGMGQEEELNKLIAALPE